MQRIGYEYCNEDLGVFDIHRHGPEIATRLDNLQFWPECIASFDVPALQKLGRDVDDVYFRGLAYRMVWSLYWDIAQDRLSWVYGAFRDERDAPTENQIKLLNAYDEVGSLMIRRRILEDEKGVVYRPGGKEVLWAFADFPYALETAKPVRDVLAGEAQTTAELNAKKHGVYVIG